MRIIHLSDIHLSEENINSFRNHYRESLIKDLLTFHRDKEIDLIIISGDVVDKAGKSLLKIDEYKGELDPYKIFEIEFIDELTKGLTLSKDRILFIAGNHDIERDGVDEIQEAGLKSLINSSNDINVIYNKYKKKPDRINISRMGKFLDFEKRFHENNKELSYIASDFTSTAIYNYNGNKVGIALVNDSWRCGNEKVNDHFVACDQLFEARNKFIENQTCFNIAVIHHPFDVLNTDEKKSIENIFKYKEYNLALIGHEHSERTEIIGTHISNWCFCTRGRSAFDKPHETHKDYISGYTIIDVNFEEKKIRCKYQIYNKNSFAFDPERYDGEPYAEFTYGISKNINERIIDKKDFS